MTDEQKAERKALIAANKAMRAATETRRSWVRDYLARRSTRRVRCATPPKSSRSATTGG